LGKGILGVGPDALGDGGVVLLLLLWARRRRGGR
jgi:hypothetical protein